MYIANHLIAAAHHERRRRQNTSINKRRGRCIGRRSHQGQTPGRDVGRGRCIGRRSHQGQTPGRDVGRGRCIYCRSRQGQTPCHDDKEEGRLLALKMLGHKMTPEFPCTRFVPPVVADRVWWCRPPSHRRRHPRSADDRTSGTRRFFGHEGSPFSEKKPCPWNRLYPPPSRAPAWRTEDGASKALELHAAYGEALCQDVAAVLQSAHFHGFFRLHTERPTKGILPCSQPCCRS